MSTLAWLLAGVEAGDVARMTLAANWLTSQGITAQLPTNGSKRVIIKRLKERPMPGIPAPAPTHNIYGATPAPKVQPKRLHPLHSAQFVSLYVQDTGCYFDTERCTGRTLVLALTFITQALKNPHTVINVRDHEDRRVLHERLVKTIHELTDKLGIGGFLCKPSALTVEFTTPIPSFAPLIY